MGHVTWPSLAFSGRAVAEAAANIPDELGVSDAARNILSGLSFRGPSTAAEPRDGTVLFLQFPGAEPLARLAGLRGCLVILPASADPGSLEAENAVLFARNPKYAYALLMTALLPLSVQRGNLTGEPAPGVRADPGFVLEEGVTIEPFVTIGPDVSIGRGTCVMRGASIGPRTRIGKGCVIGEMAVIGSPGFGFAFDGDRPPVRIPQLGGVVIGDRAEIGVLSCVDSGTIDATVVEEDVKMNSHVHIAHNCRIGRGSILGAAVSVSGSARIGVRCWLGPGAVVRNKVFVGEGATVGMGAVVVKDVGSFETVTGVPAKPS
ncbi:MAG TPA: UDP-3-O-(3-hydroxymyristoyl)glucosamine N-acyltransferase, partial [Magnetospirillaceae bacterium]|nr:UDP-3-O-(3-hydroxymyristoyl)glucosamine N-acyltransferase [Magnetospirillaceae bacterium]